MPFTFFSFKAGLICLSMSICLIIASIWSRPVSAAHSLATWRNNKPSVGSSAVTLTLCQHLNLQSVELQTETGLQPIRRSLLLFYRENLSSQCSGCKVSYTGFLFSEVIQKTKGNTIKGYPGVVIFAHNNWMAERQRNLILYQLFEGGWNSWVL